MRKEADVAIGIFQTARRDLRGIARLMARAPLASGPSKAGTPGVRSTVKALAG